jgi:hypothetical protein
MTTVEQQAGSAIRPFHEYTAEAAKAGGPEDASLGMLWHKLLQRVAWGSWQGRGKVWNGRLDLPRPTVIMPW